MSLQIREPAVSDMFYPADPVELRKMLTEYLEKAPLYLYKPEAVASPHAGYIYSGPVAAVSYKQFLNLDPDKHYTILLVGPSHYVPFEGISFGYYDYWLTPLGEVKVNKEEIERFVANNRHLPITLNTIPHLKEHSLEVQVPFLQMVLEDFSIIPVVYGQVHYSVVEEVIAQIKDNRDDVVVVISTDLSHYYPDHMAREIDINCNMAVEHLDLSLLDRCEACGKIGLEAIINYSRRVGWKGKVLDYKTSGDTSGDRSAVVGYASYIFYKEE
ncbi:AmmeMemoRadiSam system protein B [Persephonella sp. IF05-L8]|uniref:AmmeMemoRadiSam system protein B n=1 Tax=Persephonella sp. IF05-L8 TaxID=1158338 RepID=UPI000495A2DC